MNCAIRSSSTSLVRPATSASDAVTSVRLSVASSAMRATADAAAAASLGGTSRPVRPCSTIVRTPPTSVATTGRPAACASKSTDGTPSVSETWRNAWLDAVPLPELLAGFHVARELERLRDAELLRTPLERRPVAALADHFEPPAGVALAEELQHIGEQQRVLLGLEPTDAQKPELALPAAIQRLLRRHEVGGRDLREADREHRRASARERPLERASDDDVGQRRASRRNACSRACPAAKATGFPGKRCDT